MKKSKCETCGGEVSRMMSDVDIYDKEMRLELENERLERLRDEIYEEGASAELERIERERGDQEKYTVDPIFGEILKGIDRR